MSGTATAGTLNCSFCGKTHLDVSKLVAGPGVYICNECVDLCTQIISAEASRSPAGDTPSDLKAWDALSDDELLAETVKAHGAHQNVDRAVGRHVAVLRERGVSWARIGEALGMTRQSAWERFSGED